MCLPPRPWTRPIDHGPVTKRGRRGRSRAATAGRASICSFPAGAPAQDQIRGRFNARIVERARRGRADGRHRARCELPGSGGRRCTRGWRPPGVLPALAVRVLGDGIARVQSPPAVPGGPARRQAEIAAIGDAQLLRGWEGTQHRSRSTGKQVTGHPGRVAGGSARLVPRGQNGPWNALGPQFLGTHCRWPRAHHQPGVGRVRAPTASASHVTRESRSAQWAARAGSPGGCASRAARGAGPAYQGAGTAADGNHPD